MLERVSPHTQEPSDRQSKPLSKTEEVMLAEREVSVRALLMRLANFRDELKLIVGQEYVVREGKYHTKHNSGTLNEGIISVKDLREGFYEGLREYDLAKRQKIQIKIKNGVIVPFAVDTTYYIEPNLDYLKEMIPDFNAQEDFIEKYVAEYMGEVQKDRDTGLPNPFRRH